MEKVLKEQIEEICPTSLLSDQNLLGPHVARQQQLWIDICCGRRPTSAANPPPTLLLFIDGTDRRTDGRTDTRPSCDAYRILCGPRNKMCDPHTY